MFVERRVDKEIRDMLQRIDCRVFVVCVAVSSLLGAACATGDEEPLGVGTRQVPLITAVDAVPGQYIVVLERAAPAMSLASVQVLASRVQARADSRLLRTYSVLPAFAARLSPAALDEIRRDPAVAYVEEDGRASVVAVHDVGSGPDGLDRIDQRVLPRDGQYDDHDNDGAGVHAYVVDTGIRSTHAEFTGRIGSMSDFVDDGRAGEDCHGHGSHVASTVAGARYGVAKAATLHAVRVLDCNGSGSFSGVIAGVDHVGTDCASRGGPCVANMSLGGGFSQAVNDAVAGAVEAGVAFAVAAGNENQNACSTSPASEPVAITVGAVDDSDKRASFSNFGTCVDIFAPGVSILGAAIDSDSATQSISGTSMASPHVAGVMASFLGANPDATPADVEAALETVAGQGCVASPGTGSPNLLLHDDFDAEPYQCSGGSPPPPDNSCQGYCGDRAPSGCYCDVVCSIFGDCCPDKRRICR
jgi:subtilisin family serine protease